MGKYGDRVLPQKFFHLTMWYYVVNIGMKKRYSSASAERYDDKANKFIGVFKALSPFEGMFVKIEADNPKDAMDMMKRCFPEHYQGVMRLNREEWDGADAPDGLLPMGVIYDSVAYGPKFCSFDEPDTTPW